MPTATPQATARRLLIVWWSMTGATRQLAEAAAAGARQAVADAGGQPVEVTLLRADQAGPDDVLAASALLLATPENLASMAGMTKDFFDRCWYPVLDHVNGRPFAAIVCAGSDGQGTIRQIERFATGWRLRAVAPPLLVLTHAQTAEAILAPKTITPDDQARAAELGATLAAGLSLGMW